MSVTRETVARNYDRFKVPWDPKNPFALGGPVTPREGEDAKFDAWKRRQDQKATQLVPAAHQKIPQYKGFRTDFDFGNTTLETYLNRFIKHEEIIQVDSQVQQFIYGSKKTKKEGVAPQKIQLPGQTQFVQFQAPQNPAPQIPPKDLWRGRSIENVTTQFDENIPKEIKTIYAIDTGADEMNCMYNSIAFCLNAACGDKMVAEGAICRIPEKYKGFRGSDIRRELALKIRDEITDEECAILIRDYNMSGFSRKIDEHRVDDKQLPTWMTPDDLPNAKVGDRIVVQGDLGRNIAALGSPRKDLIKADELYNGEILQFTAEGRWEKIPRSRGLDIVVQRDNRVELALLHGGINHIKSVLDGVQVDLCNQLYHKYTEQVDEWNGSAAQIREFADVQPPFPQVMGNLITARLVTKYLFPGLSVVAASENGERRTIADNRQLPPDQAAIDEARNAHETLYEDAILTIALRYVRGNHYQAYGIVDDKGHQFVFRRRGDNDSAYVRFLRYLVQFVKPVAPQNPPPAKGQKREREETEEIGGIKRLRQDVADAGMDTSQ